MRNNKELCKIEKRENWKDSIALNQIDGDYKPSKELKDLIEKEVNGEISTNEIVKALVEKYTVFEEKQGYQP